ncbi:AraC family transcriptional regulator [Burkholderia sp. Ax-1719]|uniref:helix-turn-helix transcriptional regulator n=1 Tax=Burkholderia sp. Ax-1719 TaxID=2608334 RepID=UPI00141EAA71|nr:AraC family transcriptional regulator [Burkholderia sp. Ax-1719]NIE63088.1 helix-turn-helix transcriptional regulator [Burkholderia sp. Ax-1719]
MPEFGTAEIQTNNLLESLLNLARSRDSLPCDCLRSVQAHQVNKYEVDGATLSFPLLGHFKYREHNRWVSVLPGSILVVPNARSIDIEYIPDEAKGEVVALSVVLMDEQLEAARLLLAAPPSTEIGSVASIPVASLLEQLKRWTQTMQHGQRALSLHAMVGIVLCLYESGYTAILHPQAPSIAMTVRKLVTRNPGHNWQSAELEGLTGLSGATLRRRMADESTTLRSVIADARMSEGLRLLMTSRLPVKTVAARVGYNSVASFSRQFVDRYGTEPSRFR